MADKTTGRQCVYCKLPVASMQHSKNRWVCLPCNRDMHYYHEWRRKITKLGLAVAELEVANLQRRTKLIQQAARGVVLGDHVRWVGGDSTQGRRGKGLDRIEREETPQKSRTS